MSQNLKAAFSVQTNFSFNVRFFPTFIMFEFLLLLVTYTKLQALGQNWVNCFNFYSGQFTGAKNMTVEQRGGVLTGCPFAVPLLFANDPRFLLFCKLYSKALL